MPTEKGITEFIELYQKNFGVKLSRQEAFNLLENFINLVKFACEEKEN